MRFVAVVRQPASPEDAAKAVAGVLGLTLAEARMRLAPEPPALLGRLEPEAATGLVHALRKAGVAALSVDEHVPTDKDRIVARSFVLSGTGAIFTPRFGNPVEVHWDDVAAVLRGQRTARVDVEHHEKTKQLSVTKALVTGGVWMTRTATRTRRSSEESSEQVVLVYPREGPSVLLSEREVDFGCLGSAIQPSSTTNIVELARRVNEHARSAFRDDRLLRLGRRPLPFVAESGSRSSTRTVTVTSTGTGGSLDVLAEIIGQAVKAKLLP